MLRSWAGRACCFGMSARAEPGGAALAAGSRVTSRRQQGCAVPANRCSAGRAQVQNRLRATGSAAESRCASRWPHRLGGLGNVPGQVGAGWGGVCGAEPRPFLTRASGSCAGMLSLPRSRRGALPDCAPASPQLSEPRSESVWSGQICSSRCWSGRGAL